MSQAWGAVPVNNVLSTTGNLTQLFPTYYAAGTGSSSQGTAIRSCTDGKLLRVDINPSDSVGGRLELWDIAGQTFGASGVNTNLYTQLTEAYRSAQATLGQAKLMWSIDFKGDSANATKTFATPTPVMRGLAARFIYADAAENSKAIQLNLVVEGCAIYIDQIG